MMVRRRTRCRPIRFLFQHRPRNRRLRVIRGGCNAMKRCGGSSRKGHPSRRSRGVCGWTERLCARIFGRTDALRPQRARGAQASSIRSRATSVSAGNRGATTLRRSSVNCARWDSKADLPSSRPGSPARFEPRPPRIKTCGSEDFLGRRVEPRGFSCATGQNTRTPIDRHSTG